MIKINLSNAKKQVDLTNVGGLDFTVVKYKALILVIVLIYLPDFLILPMWETQVNEINDHIQAKTQELNKLKRSLSQTKDFENQIRELKAQEENLGKKLLAVKQAISEKKNPAALLLYIARNTPASLWIKELTITNDSMVIKGESLDYTSIGNFVNGLRSSVFIKDANITGTSSNVRDTDKKRVEAFEVKFTIARFDQ